MYQLILLIHVFAAVAIIALVLIQQGKGAAVGAAFGSGASQTVFGSRGSGSFLFRFTIGFMFLFFVTSILLNYMAVHAYKKQAAIMNAVALPIPERPEAKIPATGSATKAVTPATVDKTEKMQNGIPSPMQIPSRK